MFAVMVKLAGLVRFVKGWHFVNDFTRTFLGMIRLPILLFTVLLLVLSQLALIMKAFEHSIMYR